MAEPTISFTDGVAYERFMGIWSGLVGDRFLDWLGPAPGLCWADIGCGNGAFTARLLDRCAPAFVEGIDPSEGQLAYARERLAGRPVRLTQGSAAALPYADASQDAAVMALVIFFVPDPAKGVAEMARVTAPGGSVSAYAWDMAGAGHPIAPIQAEMQALGLNAPRRPQVDASRREAEARQFTVTRRFPDFESYWSIGISGPSGAAFMPGMAPEVAAELKARVRARMPEEADGSVTATATANAVKGRKG
jgi:ubiquinone/menaquinone biosynthesis C-methylase UbiE